MANWEASDQAFTEVMRRIRDQLSRPRETVVSKLQTHVANSIEYYGEMEAENLTPQVTYVHGLVEGIGLFIELTDDEKDELAAGIHQLYARATNP